MKLHMLESRNISGYVSFGSCWNKGDVHGADFCLTDAQGNAVPMQTEIAARWMDGSIKWARHTADSRLMGQAVEVLPGKAALPARSPMPFKVQSIWLTPTPMQESELATAIPRSLWQ